MTKKFILNADDFGLSKSINRAVLEAYKFKILKSVSLAANGEAFDEAIGIASQCPELGIGIHLNITSGKSVCTDLDMLTNSNLEFNLNFFQLLYQSYNPKQNDFLPQIEREFRRQIENVLSKTKVSHIDSHNHIHAIPPIFDLVCRLAREYGINHVRTHFENMYFVPEPLKNFNRKYFLNVNKKFLLNFLTIFNENTVHKYGLKTNDYLLGVSYGANMDALTISYGLKGIKYDNVIVEAFIHPCRYDEGTIDNHFDEFMITRNKKLADKILRLGYDITNYVEKNSEQPKE